MSETVILLEFLVHLWVPCYNGWKEKERWGVNPLHNDAHVLINATCTQVLSMVRYQILQILLLLPIIHCFTLSSDISYNIDQIDTNKTKRKDTQYYCDKKMLISPPGLSLSVLITYLWISESPRLVLTECLFERRGNISQVLMIRDSPVWAEYKISLSSSCSNIARSAWVWQIIRGCMITDKQLFFSLLWFSVRQNQKKKIMKCGNPAFGNCL